MKIMAIDAGVANIGVVVMGLEGDIGASDWAPIEMRLVETEADPRKKRVRQADSDMERVETAYSILSGMVTAHGIRRMVVEMPVAGGQSAPAVKNMAYASAICACLRVQHNLFAEYYSPGEVRKALLGRWTSSKKEAGEMMLRMFPQAGDQFPQEARREHVLDALAVFMAALKIGNVTRA